MFASKGCECATAVTSRWSRRYVVDATTSSYSPLKKQTVVLQGSGVVEALKPPKYPPIRGGSYHALHEGFRVDAEWEYYGVYKEAFGCKQTRSRRFPSCLLDYTLTPLLVIRCRPRSCLSPRTQCDTWGSQRGKQLPETFPQPIDQCLSRTSLLTLTPEHVLQISGLSVSFQTRSPLGTLHQVEGPCDGWLRSS